MSFIVKGIDLPKKGEYLNISINNSGEVTLVHLISLEKTDAQAIQIPKDHGNIIDESKAVVTETIDGYYEITAPTILEAEGVRW